MPIYEFYCEDCNTIFNFFSKTINTTKKPKCPKCKTKKLSRQMSAFSFTGKAKEDSDMDDLPFDETKMEKAMQMLAGEAENINEEDPRQAANLMRKLTDMTGLELGPGEEPGRTVAHGQQGHAGQVTDADLGGHDLEYVGKDLDFGAAPFAEGDQAQHLLVCGFGLGNDHLVDGV